MFHVEQSNIHIETLDYFLTKEKFQIVNTPQPGLLQTNPKPFQENINLYLIKFTFRKPNVPLDISYKSGGEFISCYRSSMYSEPMCQPF